MAKLYLDLERKKQPSGNDRTTLQTEQGDGRSREGVRGEAVKKMKIQKIKGLGRSKQCVEGCKRIS